MKKLPVDQLLALFSLAWILLTCLSGFFLTHKIEIPYFSQYHPHWTVLSMIPIIFIQFYWIQRESKEKKRIKIESFTTSRMGLVIWIVMALLTGLAASMEFFPKFFHIVVVWPLMLFVIWDSIKIFFSNSLGH